MPRAGRVPQDSLHGLPEEPPIQRKAQRRRHHAFKNCRGSLLTTVIVAPRVSPAALSRAVPAALACFSTALNAKASSFGRNHFRALSWHEDFSEALFIMNRVPTACSCCNHRVLAEFVEKTVRHSPILRCQESATAREERRALRPPLSPCPRASSSGRTTQRWYQAMLGPLPEDFLSHSGSAMRDAASPGASVLALVQG
eukprot:scaffold56691_cov89-Phaeocystis_antarctica.AAC.2